ncbi:MAG: type III glutamate--ammonia ligase [Actinomycetota bacterium]|nr:type III glutamate--ammonia ligase [Actinomycetota bacterium]
MNQDDAAALEAAVGESGVRFVLAMFVDLRGRPCAKLIPAHATDTLCGGAAFAGFAAGELAQTPADPDAVALPDPRSFLVAPWEPEVGVVMCDLSIDGETLWPYAPRAILRRQLDRLAERDMTMMVGAEAEYSLLRRADDGTLVVADERDTAAAPCYDALGVLRMLPHLGEVSQHLDTLGFGNYANDHEDGNGQFEQNFRYADALTTADRIIFFRFMVKALAERRGLVATFMPKPFSDVTGNGMHMHASLWSGDGGQALFPANGEIDEKGLGLSPLGYQFIGGVLRHAPSMAALTCPTVNSYKRLGAHNPTSGATWAPSYVAYGGNNRTHLVRIPEGDRLEYRGVDGAANPYLAASALLIAGLDGIDSKLDPGAPNTANLFDLSPAELTARGIRSLPPTLLHAADELAGNDVLREALGSGERGDVIDVIADYQRRDFIDWHAQVTPNELDRFASAY